MISVDYARCRPTPQPSGPGAGKRARLPTPDSLAWVVEAGWMMNRDLVVPMIWGEMAEQLTASTIFAPGATALQAEGEDAPPLPRDISATSGDIMLSVQCRHEVNPADPVAALQPLSRSAAHCSQCASIPQRQSLSCRLE